MHTVREWLRPVHKGRVGDSCFARPRVVPDFVPLVSSP